MKKNTFFLLNLLLSISLLSCSNSETNKDVNSDIANNNNEANSNESPNSTISEIPDGLILFKATTSIDMPGVGDLKETSPKVLVAQMTAGWNLGNYFDVPFENKSQWGNPEPTKELISKVKSSGFNTIRIPVTWRTHQENTPPYQIEEAYLKRVKVVVDYAMENDMFIMLNTHHDTDVFQPKVSTEARVSERLKNTWLQIATYFEAYDEKLLFEILNEPRVQGNSEEWYAGNASTRRVLNNLHKVGVDAIRSTGGNNTKRQLIISTWAGKTNNTAMNALTIPNNDPNIIVTVHAYTPFEVAHDAKRLWNGQADLNTLTQDLENVKRKWIDNSNRAVILGEWAMLNNNPDTGRSTTKEQRAAYSEIYIKEAKKRGMPTVLWDDNGWYRALNRQTLEWDSPGQIEAIEKYAQ